MKLDKVGYVVTHKALLAPGGQPTSLGLCFDDGSSIADRAPLKKHIGTSLFYDESVTVFDSRGDANAALKRTAKFRFAGEMKIVPVNRVKR